MKADLIFLGTGTSEGIPRLSCLTKGDCAVCNDAIKPGSPNRRRNVSGVLRWKSDPTGPAHHVQIDCGKGFWESALIWFPHHKIDILDALLLTHAHADQMGGLDDLRDITLRMTRGPLPFYASAKDFEVVKKTYPYLLDGVSLKKGGGVANLQPITFDKNPFRIADCEFTPIPVWHGKDYVSHGFRFGKTAWLGDISAWMDETPWSLVEGLDLMVLDALRPKPHPTHFHLEQSLEFVKKTRPKKCLLVDMTHDFEHEAANKELAEWSRKEGLDVQLAHDGMRVGIELGGGSV